MASVLPKLHRWIWIMAYWPPYLGTGIRIKSVNKTATRYLIQLKLRPYNKNTHGTHFGGSLYSMCDPWFAFCASAYFGSKDYAIWDKSASIDYVRPGKGTVTALFEITQEKLAAMKAEVDSAGRKSFTFKTKIYDEDENMVAAVVKEIYIRKK